MSVEKDVEEGKVERKGQARAKGPRIDDMEELREVLKVVREEVPGLLKDLTGPLKELSRIVFITNEAEAEERAKAIAKFYNELVKAGIDQETAMNMTKSNFVSPMDMVQHLGKLENLKHLHKEWEKDED